MTSTQVMGVGSILMNVSGASFQDGMTQKDVVSFSEFMKSSSNQTSTKETDTNVEPYAAKEYAGKKDIPQKLEIEKSKTISEEEAKNTLSEKADKLVEQVAEELGVSVEEIEAAMQELGITAIALFQPEMLTQLVLTVSGENDMLSLLTNGDLYDSLNQLLSQTQTMLSQIQEALAVSPQQMQEILTQMQAIYGTELETEIPQEMMNLTEESVPGETSIQENEAEMVISESQTATAIVKQATEQMGQAEETNKEVIGTQEKNTTEQVSGKQETEVAVTEEQATGKLESQTSNDNQQEQKSGDDKQSSNEGMLGNQTISPTMTGQATPIPTATFEAIAAYTTPSATAIGDQLIEYMKLNASPEITEMELQLQPASLGTINLQLTYKNGAITAQFIAQSEAVKSAIEMQVVQLKTTLEDQGIKIEAVEVTVASHEFERTMEQGGKQQDEANNQNARETGTARKRMVLDELESEQELNEEELIQVSMMRENGVTIELEA